MNLHMYFYVSRVAVKRKLNILYTEEPSSFFSDLSSILHGSHQLLLIFGLVLMAAASWVALFIIICNGMLKNNILFFKEVPLPHAAINIRNRF